MPNSPLIYRNTLFTKANIESWQALSHNITRCLLLIILLFIDGVVELCTRDAKRAGENGGLDSIREGYGGTACKLCRLYERGYLASRGEEANYVATIPISCLYTQFAAFSPASV